jgi:hypothetical protein
MQQLVLTEPRTETAARRRDAVQFAGPVLVVAVVLLLLARATYVKQSFKSLAGFIDVGAGYGQIAGVRSLAVNALGYDGQYYYYIARDPGVIAACAHNAPSCPLDYLREVRSERILYPLMARALALGQPALLPFTLLLVNFLAILITTLLVSLLCRAAGASLWLGAAAGLFCGETLAFLRDLTDPFGVMWMVVAVYLLRKQRPLLAALAVAAALLAREQLVFYVPFLAIPLAAQRQWRTLAWSAVLALGPFLVWQVVLRALYGSWPLTADSGAATLVPVPFGGLWQDRTTGDFKLVVAAVAVPLVVAVVVAVVALRRSGLRSLLSDPLPAMVLVYCVLFSMTYWFNWGDIYAPSRLAAPGIVLGVLITPATPRLLRGSYGWLLAATSLFELARNLSYLLPLAHH